MARITIFGAGITGMAIASRLPKHNKITIVARDLPGDGPSQDWASPWACAGWVALGGSSPREEQMQLDTLQHCLKLAEENPESSVRRVQLTDVHDVGIETAEGLWYHGRVPGYQVMDAETSKQHGGCPKVVVKYTSFVLSPTVFLPWLRNQLEAAGVQFQRIGTIKALSELKYLGHDVLINASGLASQTLADVKDEKVVMDRTYVTVVKSEYNEAFVRRTGGQYTYIFGRGDGAAAVGGISLPVSEEIMSVEEARGDMLGRAHESLPEEFPDEVSSQVVEDLVGLRPLRPAGVRVEKENVDGQTVVHAYGTTAGGYIFSFGLAQEVAKLVGDNA